jgi:hypothetical protein
MASSYRACNSFIILNKKIQVMLQTLGTPIEPSCDAPFKVLNNDGTVNKYY